MKTLYYIWACLFSFFFTRSTLLVAQSIQPAFLNYTTDDGLPSSETYDILQDKKGYIWISSDNGVSRFDGTNFKNYGTEEGLLDKTILFMHEDYRGWIWMSTFSGNFYIHRGDTIVPFKYNHFFKQDRGKYVLIHDFIVDEDGVLHASLMGDKILAITPTGDTSIWKPQQLKPSEYGVYETDAGFLQYSSGDQRRLDQPNEIALLFFSTTAAKHSQVRHLLKNQFQRISGKQPVYFFKLGDDYFFQFGQKIHFCETGIQTRASINFTHGTINCFLESYSGQIFVGLFENKGLYVYKDQAAFERDQVQYVLFDDLTITHLAEDVNGGIWAATQGQGIFHIPSMNIKHVTIDKGADNYSAIASAYPIRNEVYLTTVNGRVLQYNEQAFQKELPNIKGVFSTTLFYFNPHTQKLIKSAPLAVFDHNQWSFFYRGTTQAIDTNMVMGKIIDGLPYEQNFGIAASVIWNFFYDEKQQRYVANLYDRVPELSKITCMTGRKLNQLWVGSASGLYRYSTVTHVVTPVNDSLLANEHINCLKILPDESLLIGTKRRGLFHYKDGNFTQPSINSKLIEHPVNSINVDKHGDIWVRNRLGIHKLNYQDTIAYNFLLSTLTGLPSNEVIDLAFINDEVWTIDKNEVTIFPLDIDKQDFTLSIIIEDIFINEHATDATHHLKIPHDGNIKVQFTTLNFAAYHPSRYRYRLDEKSQWIETTENIINFVDLAPSNYLLEIQALQNDQHWCKSTALPIVVSPPFWQTRFFIVLCFLFALLIIYWLFKRQLKLLAKEQERLKLQEQVTQLKQKAYRAQMNPHFIFNCMSTIQGMIIGEEEERNKAIKMLANFSQLIRSALEFSEVDNLSLKEEVELLNNYLSLEQIRFNHNFTYDIRIDAELEPDWIQLPPMLVQPFVENAVLHGMEGKDGNGKIILTYQLIDDLLQVTISDNGPGISVTKALKAQRQSKFAHKSLGMTITQRRLEILNDINYKINIEEPVDENGQVQGTTVTIHIPVKH